MLFLAPEAARDTMCDTGSPPRRPAGTLMTPNLTRTLCLPTVATTLLAVLLAGCNPAPDRSYAGYIEGEWMYLAAPLGGYLDTLPVARGSRVAASAPVFFGRGCAGAAGSARSRSPCRFGPPKSAKPQ
jgi:hypothetical protein